MGDPVKREEQVRSLLISLGYGGRDVSEISAQAEGTIQVLMRSIYLARSARQRLHKESDAKAHIGESFAQRARRVIAIEVARAFEEAAGLTVYTRSGAFDMKALVQHAASEAEAVIELGTGAAVLEIKNWGPIEVTQHLRETLNDKLWWNWNLDVDALPWRVSVTKGSGPKPAAPMSKGGGGKEGGGKGGKDGKDGKGGKNKGYKGKDSYYPGKGGGKEGKSYKSEHGKNGNTNTYKGKGGSFPDPWRQSAKGLPTQSTQPHVSWPAAPSAGPWISNSWAGASWAES